MTYEKDRKGIPEYAMLPAKAPGQQETISKPTKAKEALVSAKIIPAEAVFHKERMVCPANVQQMVYQFEEDILVPDTRADMGEILLIDGTCDLSPMQKKLTPKVDDLLNMTGTAVLQVLYNPEGEGMEPVAVTTKVPYKYQWAMNLTVSAEAYFSCRLKAVDAMMINERKFRVKISLEFTVQLYNEREFHFFEGLRSEPLEMKRREVPFICLGAVKRDEVTIDETFCGKDKGAVPESILKQEFTIVENYRQVTREKIVINGFIYVSLLYLAASGAGRGEGDGQKARILPHNQRVEFTQFVPLEKDLKGKTFSAIRTSFSAENLRVAVGFHGEQGEDEEAMFHITGEVKTKIELFESRRRVTVVDAYHRERPFDCQRDIYQISGISDAAAAEVSVREIVSLADGVKAMDAVFCSVKIVDAQCTCEKGRVSVTGELLASALWRGAEGSIRCEKRTFGFRGTVDMESAFSGQKAAVMPVVKSAWAELINEKQLEVNASLLLSVEVFDERELPMLSNPHFIDGERGRDYPMMIAAMQPGESLWDMAKRYRTTEENIRTANRLDGEPRAGQRLLIVR